MRGFGESLKGRKRGAYESKINFLRCGTPLKVSACNFLIRLFATFKTSKLGKWDRNGCGKTGNKLFAKFNSLICSNPVRFKESKDVKESILPSCFRVGWQRVISLFVSKSTRFTHVEVIFHVEHIYCFFRAG